MPKLRLCLMLAAVFLVCGVATACRSSYESSLDNQKRQALQIAHDHIEKAFPEFALSSSASSVNYTDKIWVVLYSGLRDRSGGKFLTQKANIVTIIRRDNLEVVDSRYN